MSDFLDFEKVSTEEWKKKIITDLKGKDYSSLVSNTLEGIEIEPIHTPRKESTGPPIPAQSRLRQDICAEDALLGNKVVLESLMAGVSSIGFDHIEGKAGIHELLSDVILDIIHIHIHTRDGERTFITLQELFEDKGKDLAKMKGSIGFDPLGELIRTGQWIDDGTIDEENFVAHFKRCESLNGIRSVLVNGHQYMDAGADHLNDLAITLSHINEYYESGKRNGITAESLCKRLIVSTAVDTDFFMSIAKLKALRKLIGELSKGHGVRSSEAFIVGRNSQFNMSPIDQQTNLLRLTTMGMSICWGGCNEAVLSPFNGEYSEFAMRLSRNIHKLFDHESYFDKVIDPTSGSDLIEHLYNDLCLKAWDMFKNIESKGGFAECTKSGQIQRTIESIAERKAADLMNGKSTWIGANSFLNEKEGELESIELISKEGSACQSLAFPKYVTS